jgi:hypothetical protein
MTENITTYTYLRTAGEKCKLYKLNKRNNKFNINNYPGIQYGDIIYEHGGYRAVNTFIFADAFKKLSSMGPGNGSGGIDSYITKNIEDPISFFSGAVMKADIFEFEFDTKAHMLLLRKIAGNRDINPEIYFVYDVHNEYVRFESAKLYNGETHEELCLCPEIQDCYLDNKPFTEIDPITQTELNNSNPQDNPQDNFE